MQRVWLTISTFISVPIGRAREVFSEYAVHHAEYNHNQTRLANIVPAYKRLLLITICINFSVYGHAEDWPQWRGTNRNAVSSETKLLSSWGDTSPELLWRASGIGDGYSSVVIADGQVFTTGKIDDAVLCFALDLQSGQHNWTTKIGTTSRNVMATPTFYDGLVYVLDPDGELVCLDADNGTQLWQRSLTADFGGQLMSGRGYSESPLIDRHRLICTPGGDDAMLVSLDRRTGKVIWKSRMPKIGEKGRDGAAFSSVVLSEATGVRQYIQLTGRGLAGFEAKTGTFLWGYNDISNETANIPTPIVHDDFVFSANGYHSGAVLLRLARINDGDGIDAQEIYRLRGNKFQNHHGGFVLIDDHIYGGHGSNNGLPTCIEFHTGKILWKRRGPGTGSASVTAADGRLYFHYQNGVIGLIGASNHGYRLHGKFRIPAGGDSWAHPVVAHGRLFVREKDDLWVHDLRRLAPAVDSHSTPAMTMTRNTDDVSGLYRFATKPNATDSSIPILTLTDTELDSEGLIADDQHRQLREQSSPFILVIPGTQISNSGLRQISELENLVGLNLESCRRITDRGFAYLGRSKQLAVLIATATSISATGLDHLAPAPALTAINLEVCDDVTDTGCEALGRMTALRALVLKKTGFEQDRISDAGLKQLSGLKDLELLSLSGNLVTDDGLRHLKPLSKLDELDLSLLPITDDAIRHLAPLKQLRQLELLYSEGFAGANVTDKGLETLGAFTQLTHLNLVGAKISDSGLKHIHRLRKLVHLRLTNSTATEADVRNLKNALPNCEIIRH
ncbi:MAG: PQQ-binding-like beta-propeller repeat protein [Fuerstiella sp.]|nr:PQQ-binding-like beta-propeller repeat protein [Fuerstiella sp.]